MSFALNKAYCNTVFIVCMYIVHQNTISVDKQFDTLHNNNDVDTQMIMTYISSL